MNGSFRASCVLATLLVASASAQHSSTSEVAREGWHAPTQAFDCGYRSPAHWKGELRAGIARGEIADPALRPRPTLPPSSAQLGVVDPTPCLTREHVFAFEDSSQVLLSDFSDAELLDLMAQAFNAMIAAHGDVYDFGGYFLNYTPDHQIGGAFYMPIFNDVSGLGDPSTVGTPIFDDRVTLGVGASGRIHGYVMMWVVDSWEPGAGAGAAFARLVLGQEFEHRWALFLPDLLGGRAMQGDNGACGRTFHWNFRVDGQGSGMEIREWTGSGPATLQGGTLNFNTDIGGVFSYTDLYLMGYVSPAEMDAGNSELRYMDGAAFCSSPYGGPISNVAAADIVAAAGARVPDSTAAQQDYRTGWIMLHLPGSPPTTADLDRAVGILEQHQLDWNFGTLGRGTMNDTLFDDCNCNGVPDGDDIAAGTSFDLDLDGRPDECDTIGTPLCSGDGSDTACPCGNVGGTGRGCDLSAGTGGVGLTATGDTGAGSVEVHGAGFPPAATPTVVVIRSPGRQNPAALFGDGLLCISTTGLVRVGASVAVGGSATRTIGHGAGPGTFFYQLWFRSNPASFCTPDAFNLSNGLQLVWP